METFNQLFKGSDGRYKLVFEIMRKQACKILHQATLKLVHKIFINIRESRRETIPTKVNVQTFENVNIS